MARTVAIGVQDFGKLIRNQCFYVDKTDFIREWWERKDDVTLIARPRRFGRADADYNDFIKAMLRDDIKGMNAYMNRVALATFSYFDTGRNPSGEEPERFYHGFVLRLLVELQDRYVITSNREMRLKRVNSFGRYDVMLEPRNPELGTVISESKNTGLNDAILLEFKVHDPEDERT